MFQTGRDRRGKGQERVTNTTTAEASVGGSLVLPVHDLTAVLKSVG